MRKVLLPVLLFAGLVSAAPGAPTAAPTGRVQILLLDLEGSVPKETVDLLGGSIASALTKHDNVEVITSAELRAMTELEASKSAAGCDQTSCLAELAAALGARYVMYGRVGAMGEAYVLQLSLFDANESRAIAREERTAPAIAALQSFIAGMVDALVVPLTTTSTAPAASLAVTATALMIGGAVVAVGSGTGAAFLEASLWSADSSVAEKQLALDVAPWLWGAAIAAGVVGAVGGTILFMPSFEGAP